MTNPNPAQLKHYVDGLDFPASPEDLARQANEQGAEQQVVDTLGKLPRGEYASPEDVSAALGEISDTPPSNERKRFQ